MGDEILKKFGHQKNEVKKAAYMKGADQDTLWEIAATRVCHFDVDKDTALLSKVAVKNWKTISKVVSGALLPRISTGLYTQLWFSFLFSSLFFYFFEQSMLGEAELNSLVSIYLY